ncbi:MAG: hypothetical protein HOH36_14200 [Acidimicrobiaceae bacterium]|nr:hypothetical protein [Acidimicrobiaceae bacterium]MDG1412167.1 hypothetical protein [Acidimicrobiales bacterium]
MVLVAAEHWSAVTVGANGSFAVVSRDDPGAMLGCLRDVDSWIGAHLANRENSERRGGLDRRVRQDWTKVGWERRKPARRR